MTWQKIALAVVIAGFWLVGTVMAAPDSDGGRYEIEPSDDGFVRLDKQTGEMSLCQRADGVWSCVPMEERRGASKDELARLQQENRDLRRDLQRMEETFGLDAPGKKKGAGDRDSGAAPAPEGPATLHLPDEEQVDQAIDYLEGMVRKLRERFQRFGDKTEPRKNRSGDTYEGGETPL